MTLIDRINARILARIRRREPSVSVDGTGVETSRRPGDAPTKHAYGDLVAAAAVLREGYADDAMALVLQFRAGETVEISEAHPQWERLLSELDRTGALETPSAIWRLELIANGRGGAPLTLKGERGEA